MFTKEYPLPIFYDLETTGLDVEADAVVSIAARLCPNWQRYFETEQSAIPAPIAFEAARVKPDCPVSAGAQRVHGLSNAELEEADPFDVVFNRFRSYCDTLRQATKCKTILLIAHNNFGFDQRLLQAQCRRFKVGHDWTDVLHGDTMQVLLDSYRFQRCECGLATIAKKCLKGRTQDHSAKGDVDLLIAVVNCMSNQCMMYDGLWELAQPLAVQLL